MQTTINWSSPFTWLIASALLLLLLIQLGFIIQSKSLPTSRKWIRAGLNGLLWLALVGYFLQPHWPLSRSATHALLIGDDVPAAIARRVADSLHIKERLSGQNLKASFDSVTLIGQNLPTETLPELSQSAVQWVPYYQPDQLQALQWNSFVRQGEMQRVTARIQSTTTQWLKLRFGQRTVDSVSLRKGDNAVRLQFPAFVNGRTQLTLNLADGVLDTLRFFTRPTQPMTVLFVLNSPDFESKTLANWLGKRGHAVTVSATLSKNISSDLTINKAGKRAPDLLITEPDNAGSATVRKAVAAGKSVLFINLTNPETDSRTINQATGSRFLVRKTSTESLVPVGDGLSALPYRFAENLNQLPAAGYPVAVQVAAQRGPAGRVGISLLSETYPLSLSGDSTAYSRIWTAILARLSPPETNTILIKAPVYQHIRQAVTLNNLTTRPGTLLIGSDTVSLVPSALNNQSTMGYYSFPTPGWQTVQDSLAVYVNPLSPNDPLANQIRVRRFMEAHARYQPQRNLPNRVTTTQLPDWAWLFILLCCFTAVWVEPKLL